MRIKAISILFLLGLAAIVSCKSTNLQNGADGGYKALLGKWSWVQSTGGFAGKTTTPQTEGHTSQLEFKAGNTVSAYMDGSLTKIIKFDLAKGHSIFSVDSVYILRYQADGLDQAVLKTTKDTLILADNVNDGFTKTYVKQ